MVVNDAADFAGTNGCYLYQGRDVQERKNKDLRGQILVLAPSEGIVPVDTWLAVQEERGCWQISRSWEDARPGIPSWPEKSSVGAVGMP